MPIMAVNLEQRLIEKAGAIADHLKRQMGVPVSRSAAVALLIDRFMLPDWSTNSILLVDQDELIAEETSDKAA